MSDPVDDGRRSACRREMVPRILLLAAFAVATFLAGRLWSLREAREAQRAAGLAEQARLELQAELVKCRNALVLQTGVGSAGNAPGSYGTEASHARAAGRALPRRGR